MKQFFQVLTKVVLITALWLSGLLALAWLAVEFIVERPAQLKTEAFKKFSERYDVGKPSAEFIQDAIAIGADMFSVTPGYTKGLDDFIIEKAENHQSPGGEWIFNRFKTEYGHENDEKEMKDLQDLSAGFRKLDSGSAQIQVTIVAPFLRDYCSIEFTDGKVTRMKVSQLD